jgi:hypothetical protein
MRKYNVIHLFTFFIFLFSIGISTGKAYALPYDAVIENSPVLIATPYPTLTPISSLPTAIPLSGAVTPDFSCPVGLPYGYGTVTPSTEWDIACGHCLPTATPAVLSTSTAGPTRTPWGGGGTALPPICITVPAGGEECYIPTLTPVATVTPLPTSTLAVTSTVAGTYNISCATGSPSTPNTCQQINPYTIRLSVSNVSGNHPQTTVLSLRWSWGNLPVGSPLYLSVTNSEGTITDTDQYSNATVRAIITALSNYGFSPSPSYISQTIGSGVINWNYQGTGSRPTGTNGLVDGGIGLMAQSATGGTWTSVSSATITLSTIPISPTPTPTITLTPLGGDFCDSVSNSTVPNQFNLGGTGGITNQTCYVFPGIYYQDIIDAIVPAWLSPFTMVFNSLFPSSAGIDPLTFCVRQRDYSLYIFGYRLPYEALLGLGVFLASIRIFNPTAFAGVASLGSTKHGESGDYKVSSSSVTRGSDGSITYTKKFTKRDKS